MFARQTWHEKCMNIIFSVCAVAVLWWCFGSFCLLLKRMRPTIWSRLVADPMRVRFFVLRGRRTAYEKCKVTTINIDSFVQILFFASPTWVCEVSLIGVSSHMPHRYTFHRYATYAIFNYLLNRFFFYFEFINDSTTTTTIAKRLNGGSGSSFRRQNFFISIMDFLQCQTAAKS